MKISIVLEGYLKYKYPSNILELNYSKPVTICQALGDAKIFSADVRTPLIFLINASF